MAYDDAIWNVPQLVGPCFNTFAAIRATATDRTATMADGVGDRPAFFRAIKLTKFGVMTHTGPDAGNSPTVDHTIKVYLGTGSLDTAVASAVLGTVAKTWAEGGVGHSTISSDTELRPWAVFGHDDTAATLSAFGISYLLEYQERL